MTHTVEFKKIVAAGKAMGYLDGRACFVTGPLPGEVAEVEPTKAKPRFIEATLRRIIQPSPYRHEAAEAHFRLCSPWQGVDYNYQLELKRVMLEEVFARPGLELPVLDMLGGEEVLGYRNKLEFALAEDGDGQLQLAFHARGSQLSLVTVPDGCALGTPAMNRAAQNLLARMNALRLGAAAKSLTIRRSQTQGSLVGIVGLGQPLQRDWQHLRGDDLTGVVVSRVRPGHRHETLWSAGTTVLQELVGGTAMHYPYDSFFQVNVPMFEKALAQILAGVPRGGHVVDLYGGVGAIGLPAARIARRVFGVEINAGAVAQAQANAAAAGLDNYEAIAAPAERLDPALLKGADCIVVDPPRAGLDRSVVNALLEAAPASIVYLSCNPVTQARDLVLLAGSYRARGVTGFDFYPGTLHLESLALLERI